MNIKSIAIAHIEDGISMRCGECRKPLKVAKGFFVVLVDHELLTYLLWSKKTSARCCALNQAELLYFDKFDDALQLATAIEVTLTHGYTVLLDGLPYQLPEDKIVVGDMT